MKRMLALWMAVLLCLGAVPAMAEDKPLNIVCTIFPLYDWARQIVGEEAQITVLQDSGADLHNFQPTVADMMAMKQADIIFYVGGESDHKWIDSTLASVGAENAVSLIDFIEAKEEELLPGMQEEEHDGHEETEEELDEHIWLSLRNAQTLVAAMGDALATLHPESAEAWTANAKAYIEQLAVLDGEYAALLEEASIHTLLFGDRFPFRYLADDYALTCYAAFSGCSAETEASFETIMFLVGKLKELELPAVMTIEGSDGSIARTVKENAGSSAAILTLNSAQAVPAEDIAAGVTYLSIMEENLAVLRQALVAE